MNLSSTISNFSISENDDDSSMSEIQVSRLQDEILQQSKCIEEFIHNSKQNEDSSALKVLKTLFSLFKSELSLNLTIRKVLVSERKKAGLSVSSIQSLFRSLHHSGFTNINTFEEIVTQMNQQYTEIEELVHQNKVLKKALKAEKHQNQSLSIQVSDFQKELIIKKKTQKENNHTIKSLTEKFDKSNVDIQNLNQEIIQKRDKILELEQINHDLQIKLQELETEKNSLQNQYDQDIHSSKAKAEESKMIFFNQVTNYQKEIESLKTKISEQQHQHEQEIADLHAQYLTDIEMIKKETNDKVNYLLNEKELLETNNKKEFESQKICLDSLRHSFVEKEAILNQQSEELISLKKSISGSENLNIELNKVNSILKNKLKKLTKQNKILNQQIKENSQNYTNQISTLKNTFENEKKKIESSILSKWQTKVQNVELSLHDIESVYEEQKTENKKLKEIIHKLSFNLQQEEAENAKLHAALQIKKLKKIDQKGVKQIKKLTTTKNSNGFTKRRMEFNQIEDNDISSFPLSVSISSSESDD